MPKQSALKTKSYLKKKDLLFDASKLFFAQVTDTFDFIWPTVAGMWNLRWQVIGYLTTNPNANIDDLNGRFTKGSEGSRANLKRACQEQSWDEQKEQFARFLLVNAFAIYESWASNLATQLSLVGSDASFVEKNLQFPTNGSKGITSAIARGIGQKSSFMDDLFYYGFKANPKNALTSIENLMLCYRCFKEMRNCFVHNGGVADSKLVQAFIGYAALTNSDLGTREFPKVIAPVLDNPISIDLRGVVGFYDVMLRIVATTDTEMSLASVSEGILIQRFRTSNSRKHTLGAVEQEKAVQVKRLFGGASMPVPNDMYRAERFLRDNSLVS